MRGREEETGREGGRERYREGEGKEMEGTEGRGRGRDNFDASGYHNYNTYCISVYIYCEVSLIQDINHCVSIIIS